MKLLNKNNENDPYNKLTTEAKHIVEMYITARQFKNAVLEDEIIILPTSKNGIKDGSILHWGNTTITFRGNKNLVRIYPFIVNKAFSCEVYLKLLLTAQGCDIKTMKTHNLSQLYAHTDNNIKEKIFQAFVLRFGHKVNKDFFEDEIKKISSVFEEWRYLYEKANVEHLVNYGFLNAFCDYLDEYSQITILDLYGYDVNKNMR